MAVITISREFGSEGSLIAEKAAKALGYHLADKGTIETILKEYGLMQFNEEYRTLPGFWDRFDAHRMEQRKTLIGMLNQTIQALARHGNMVIVGRGGFAVLAGLADVLNVRIQAPLELRIQRATEVPTIAEPSRAELLVKENDRLQKGFVESVYDVPWDAPHAFDLIIDTGKISVDLAAQWLVEATRSLQVPDISGTPTTAKLNVDRILAGSVEECFACAAVHP